MKRLVFCSILMIMVSMKSYSQTDTTKGILFEHGLSWQEVLEKAQKENKYVFVDCYATWCGPCKWMDKNVYTVDLVGTFMNEKFVSIRIQMDSTRQDNDEIRQWYSNARVVEKKYHVWAYPSYLFFSPDGQAVHKDVGGKDSEGFLSMVTEAMDSNQQYYTLLAAYRKGSINYGLMPTLINAAGRVGQDSLAKQISHDYIIHYLERLPEERLWTSDNILFLDRYSFAIGLDDKIFQIYYRSRATIDSIMHDGRFSDRLVNEIVYRDAVKLQVDQALMENSEPKWHHLERGISKNYDVFYAERNVLHGRVEYYKSKKRWKKYIKYFIREQEMNDVESGQPGLGTSFTLNYDAYEVFKYSKNKRDLEKAFFWVNKALTMPISPILQAAEMDTKANLLYKLGKISEGLTLEEKSHALAPWYKEITANYEKMKSGLPTWQME